MIKFILFSIFLFSFFLSSAAVDTTSNDVLEPRNEEEMRNEIEQEISSESSDVDSDPDKLDQLDNPTPTPKASPKQKWQQTVQKVQMNIILDGMRRKQNYVRNLYRESKYIMPKVWGGIVKKFDEKEEEEKEEEEKEEEEKEKPKKVKKKMTEQEEKGEKSAKSTSTKKAKNRNKTIASKETPKASSSLGSSGRRTPRGTKQPKQIPSQLLGSNEKLMRVIMRYVQLKLENMSKQYKEFIPKVQQWPDLVESVKDAFANDQEMYQKYKQITFSWTQKTTDHTKKPLKMKKTLKQIHLDNLGEMAKKFDEFGQVVESWPESGCFMTFPLEKNIFNKVFLFDYALTMKVDDLEKELKSNMFTHAVFNKDSPNDFFDNPDWSQKLENEKKNESDDEDEGDEEEEDEEDEDDVRMAANALLEALLKGRDGFTEEARLDLRKLPKWDGKTHKSKSMWEVAKGIVLKLFRWVMWSLRAFRKRSDKMLAKASNAMKSAKEREKMKKEMEEVKQDELLSKIIKSLDKAKGKEKNISSDQTKIDMEKQGIQPDKPIDHSAHEQLTEENALQHPFTFLQGVRYDFHVKPAEKQFDQLYPTQYDQVMEFYRKPIEFYKTKSLDEDTIYIMRKFVEPNKHLHKLFKKQYNLIHDFFADPVNFYRRGDKLDKTMNKALTDTLKEMDDKLKNLDAKTKILLKNPNKFLGSIEQLDAAVLDAVKDANRDNEESIKLAIIKNEKLMIGDQNMTKGEKAKNRYEYLKAFLEDPEEFCKKSEKNGMTMIRMLFQVFRKVMEVADDKDSNEELSELNIVEYQKFLQFLKDPQSFLSTAKLDEKMMDIIRDVLKTKTELFNHLTDEHFIQLKNFLNYGDAYRGQLDSSIFSKYRKTLPASAQKGFSERVKEFFVGTKLRSAFNALKTERQFDQLKRFIQHPEQFYQPIGIGEQVLESFRAVLKEIVEKKRNDQMFNKLNDEQYAQLKQLAENPAALFVQKSSPGQQKFKKASGVNKAVFDLYTEPLRRNESCAKVKPLIELALYGTEDQQKSSTDLRGRIGAQIISSVFNTKQFEGNMVLALVLSLAGSGGIAAALDLGLWHFVVHKVAVVLGHAHPVTIILMVILDSLTPLLAETVDSLIIKRTLGALEGKSFLPRTMKQFKADLKESAIAGGIAAIGSIPNNIVMSLLPGSRYLMGGQTGAFVGVLGLNALTNQIAASTSAAMVPLQLEKWHKQRSAAFYKLIQMNFFPAPQEDELITGTVTAKTFAGYCRLRALEAMEIDLVTSMAFNSMGIGAVISFLFGFLAIFIPVSYELVSDQMQRIVSIMFNTPTEILSLGAGLLTANYLGNQRIQKWTSTDYHKNKQIVQLIFEKSIEQLQDPEQQFKPISFEDIYKIYHARFQLTYRFGKLVVSMMIGLKNGVTKLFNQRPVMIDQLDEQYIDKEVLVQNWKPNVVYLVQFPRTDSSPSLSPAAIKLETWLRMKNIPFFTVSDGVLFRALFTDQVPFVEYNGQKIFGTTDEIIDTLTSVAVSKGKLGDFLKGEKKVEPIEQHMKELIENKLYSLLLLDRLQNLENPKNDEHLTKSNDFQRLVIPSLLKEAKRNWFKIQPLPKPFWDEYFAKNNTVAYGKKSWNGFGISEQEWHDFVKRVGEEHIPKALKKFVNHLKEQLSTSPFLEQLKDNNKDSDFDNIIQQIEGQLTKSKSLYILGDKNPSALDASLFGILSQFANPTTIYNKKISENLSAKLADQNDKLGEYFTKMKVIFMGPMTNKSENAQKEWPTINGQWKFDAKDKHYNGPFILRFDALKYEYEERERFTEAERKTFAPLLSTKNSESAAISGTLFSERKFLAVYPKVVTFIVHHLIRLFNMERFAIEMAELPTVVEVQSLADYIEFVPKEYEKEIVTTISAFSEKKRIQQEEKNMHVCRALIHLMASYLCDGNIDQDDCAIEHNKRAKEHLGNAFENEENNFSKLSLALRKFVYQMMFTINVEYQTNESLKMFGAAFLDYDEEQKIKYEAKRLRNAIWELEQFENGKIEEYQQQLTQFGVVEEELEQEDLRTDSPKLCNEQTFLKLIEEIRNAKKQKQTQDPLYPIDPKFNPDEFLAKQKDITKAEITNYDKKVNAWLLRKFIVVEMRALVDALDDDEKLSRGTVTFKDMQQSRNLWFNLNFLVQKCEKEDSTCKVDSDQMKKGYRMISDRKKKHIFKELWAKTVDQAEGVYTKQKYIEVLSYRLGQVRKLYEIRKSQLSKKEAVNIDKIDEQYRQVKDDLLKRLHEASASIMVDNELGTEMVEVLSKVTFTSQKQNITKDADRIRKSILKLSDFVENTIGQLKQKWSREQLKEERRAELDAAVHRKYLLKEMEKLINFLDEKKFEKNVYPFEAFKDAYFSGELFKWLREQVEKDGTNFDEDEIKKGFKYVKDHRSMHRLHKIRAFLFDGASDVVKEKKFVKKLAWRIGQLSKLYMLRKANISDADGESWATKREQLGEEMNKRWEELKKEMETEAENIVEEAKKESSTANVFGSESAAGDGIDMPLDLIDVADNKEVFSSSS